jgi:hypothetical protein
MGGDQGTLTPKLTPERRQAHSALGLLLSIAALVAAVTAVFAPDADGAGRIEWQAATSPNPAALAPFAPSVAITVSGQGAPSSLDPPMVLDTAFFSSTVGDEARAGLRVTIGPDGLVAQLVSPSGQIRESVGPMAVGGGTGGFPSAWSVNLDQGVLTLSTDTDVSSVVLPPERGIAINWAQLAGTPAPGLALTVDLAGGALDTAGFLHTLGIWAALVAVLGVVLLLWQPWRIRWSDTIGKARLHVIDVVVLVALVLSGFVSRTTYDDGWILSWARDLTSGTWGPSTPLMNTLGSTVHLFQGFLYSSLLGFTGGRFDAVIGIRSLTILMIFGTWLLLSRAIIPRVLPSTSRLLLPAAAAYVVLFGFGWMTVRQEIPVVLVSASLLALAAKKVRRHPALRIAGMMSVTAAGIATHPVGLMLVLPLAVLLVPEIVDRTVPLEVKSTGLVLGAAASIAIVFFNQTLSLFLRGLDEYEDIPVDPFNEWGRFSDMLRIGTVTQRAWFLAGLVGILALWMVATKVLLAPARFDRRSLIIFAAALMPLGIVVTATKWPWHYAALLAPMAIGLLFVVDWLGRSPRRQILIVTVGLGIAAWMGLAAKDSEFDRQWTAWLTISAGVLAFGAMLVRRRDERVRIGLAMGVVTALTAGVTVWHAVDLTVRSPSEWSFLKQSTLGLFDADLRCGLSSVIPISGTPGLTAHDVIAGSGFAAGVQFDFILQNPCYFPPARQAGTWQPAFGSGLTAEPQDPSTWLHTDVLRAGCVDVAGPGTYVYPYCFRESLPSGTPQIQAEFVE